MGFVEFLIIIVVVCLVAAVANWLLGQIPGVPAIIPRVIWIVAVLIILFALLTATGILGHDIRIPHV